MNNIDSDEYFSDDDKFEQLNIEYQNILIHNDFITKFIDLNDESGFIKWLSHTKEMRKEKDLTDIQFKKSNDIVEKKLIALEKYEWIKHLK